MCLLVSGGVCRCSEMCLSVSVCVCRCLSVSVSVSVSGSRPPPRRLQPLAIPISQPVRSAKFGALQPPCSAHVHARHDMLVWFEICELGQCRPEGGG